MLFSLNKLPSIQVIFQAPFPFSGPAPFSVAMADSVCVFACTFGLLPTLEFRAPEAANANLWSVAIGRKLPFPRSLIV